jgi:hypothetical protein
MQTEQERVYERSSLTPRDVLEALVEFDEFGGASFELIVWEYGLQPGAVVDAWEQVRAGGLVDAIGNDKFSGEQMYRLNDAGWEAEVACGGRRPRGRVPAR